MLSCLAMLIARKIILAPRHLIKQLNSKCIIWECFLQYQIFHPNKYQQIIWLFKKRINDARYSFTPALKVSMPIQIRLWNGVALQSFLVLSLRKYKVQDVERLAWHDFSQCDLEKQKKIMILCPRPLCQCISDLGLVINLVVQHSDVFSKKVTS